MIDKIKLEMSKEKPNWILISNLALQLHNETLESNYFKFTKGKLNIIKASEHNCDVIKEALEECMNGDEYRYILVGSYKGMTVTKFNKLISGLIDEVNEKYVIVITNKDQVSANSAKVGLMSNLYNGTLKNKWSRDAITELSIKGNGFSIKCPFDELKAHVRDIKLSGIGI